MSKISVIFWSQTGNTEAMANAIGQGVTLAGKEVEVLEVSRASADALKEAQVFALGCPAMGSEVLEEDEMEPFVEEVTKFVSGKHVALFGSYDWGDGEWMRDWEARMKEAGAILVGGKGLICNNDPGDDVLAQCGELGKELAAL
ncbi:flavodoxin [Konateibacter massiliensis]|uniref:flavodoxin n=1 Tax=Konateibacter massiliensis TaxID=2002841 RepID=UPI000C15E3EB|nr:flavodoxin [Konateibacter massiliensis]